MYAHSFRAPWGSLLVGRAPNFAWGAPPPLLDVVPCGASTSFCADCLVHQGQYPAPDLAMKFAAEVHDQFPRGALLGVVHVKAVYPPGHVLDSPWYEAGSYHLRVSRPRAFATPIQWRGRPGLFEVHSFEVQEAVELAELAKIRAENAHITQFPDGDELLERVAVNELDYQMTGSAARAAALDHWRQRTPAGPAPRRPYGTHRRRVD